MTKPVLPAIASHGAAKTMNSFEIAELVGSRPDAVKRAIERLADRGVIEFPPMVEIPTSTKPMTVYEFSGELGKRDSIVVVAQLSPEFTARLVDRWRELEEGQAVPAAIKDRRVTLITSALASGLITRAEAEKRIAALLDGVAPLKPAATTAAPKGQKAKTKPWRKAKPSGAMTWNLTGNTGFRLYELGHWVEGGNAEMFRALRDGGFMDGNNHFTAKGERLSCGVRNGFQMVYAEKLLRAIGAW